MDSADSARCLLERISMLHGHGRGIAWSLFVSPERFVQKPRQRWPKLSVASKGTHLRRRRQAELSAPVEHLFIPAGDTHWPNELARPGGGERRPCHRSRGR